MYPYPIGKATSIPTLMSDILALLGPRDRSPGVILPLADPLIPDRLFWFSNGGGKKAAFSSASASLSNSLANTVKRATNRFRYFSSSPTLYIQIFLHSKMYTWCTNICIYPYIKLIYKHVFIYTNIDTCLYVYTYIYIHIYLPQKCYNSLRHGCWETGHYDLFIHTLRIATVNDNPYVDMYLYIWRNSPL
jgi:hypothetical protein